MKPLSPEQRRKLGKFWRSVKPRPRRLPDDRDITLLGAAVCAAMKRELDPGVFIAEFGVPEEDVKECVEWIVAATIKTNTDPGGKN